MPIDLPVDARIIISSLSILRRARFFTRVTSELNAIKEHMRELLEKLKKAPSAEAKRELLAELAKAQRRLRDLAQSLSRLSQRVPSEFINREAIPQNEPKGVDQKDLTPKQILDMSEDDFKKLDPRALGPDQLLAAFRRKNQ